MQKKTGLCPRLSMFSSMGILIWLHSFLSVLSDLTVLFLSVLSKCTWTFCLLDVCTIFAKQRFSAMLQLDDCKNKLAKFKQHSGLKYGLIRIGIFGSVTRQYRQKRYKYCCGIGKTILVIDVWFERKSEEVIRMWSRFGEIQRFFAPNIEE